MIFHTKLWSMSWMFGAERLKSARRVNDIRGQQNALRQFIKKIELGYGIAQNWYSYPLRAFDNTDKAISPMGASLLRQTFTLPFVYQIE